MRLRVFSVWLGHSKWTVCISQFLIAQLLFSQALRSVVFWAGMRITHHVTSSHLYSIHTIPVISRVNTVALGDMDRVLHGALEIH